MGDLSASAWQNTVEPKARRNRKKLPPKPFPALGCKTTLAEFFQSYPLGGERVALCVEPTSADLVNALFECGTMDLTIPDPENEIVRFVKKTVPENAILRKAKGPSIYDLRTNRGFDLWFDPGLLVRLTDQSDRLHYRSQIKKRLRFGGYGIIAIPNAPNDAGVSVASTSALLGLYFELHAIVKAPRGLASKLPLAIFKRWVGSSGRRRN